MRIDLDDAQASDPDPVPRARVSGGGGGGGAGHLLIQRRDGQAGARQHHHWRIDRHGADARRQVARRQHLPAQGSDRPPEDDPVQDAVQRGRRFPAHRPLGSQSRRTRSRLRRAVGARAAFRARFSSFRSACAPASGQSPADRPAAARHPGRDVRFDCSRPCRTNCASRAECDDFSSPPDCRDSRPRFPRSA